MSLRSDGAPRISFEFFPPSSPEATMRLWRSVERLAPLGPEFVSVTYGAGGATRDRTRAAILAIRDRARLRVAGHLTCVGATREETLAVARSYAKMGVRRIVALRGDPPQGAARFTPHPDGYRDAADLVAGLKRDGDWRVTVAAYPEVHPDATSPKADIENLKRKLDAGADEAITQFFFDNEVYFRFLDACEKAGIDAPVVPGILPIENFAKMRKFAERCRASVPESLAKAYENADEMGMTELLSTSICAEQCDELRMQGVERLHFYTLNNPELPFNVCRALGVDPQPMQIAATGCG